MTLFVGVNSLVSLTLVSAVIVSHASSQSLVPDYIQWTRLGFVEQPENNCGEDRFECKNGGCIHESLVCDGRIDCTDQSDETRAECTKPGRTCPDGAFRCDYGACAPQNATCNGIKDCYDNSDELLDQCPRPLRHGLLLLRLYQGKSQPEITANQLNFRTVQDRGPALGIATILKTMESSKTSTTTLRPTGQPSSMKTTTANLADRHSPSKASESFCLIPPRPNNGHWWESDSVEGNKSRIHNVLAYTCDKGYSFTFPLPRCLFTGKWSRAPVCRREVDDTEKPPRSNSEINSTSPTIDSPNVRKPEQPPATIDMSDQSSKISTTTSRSIEKPTISNKSSESFCVAPLLPAGRIWILADCWDPPGSINGHFFRKYCIATPGSQLEVGSRLFYGCTSGTGWSVHPFSKCFSTEMPVRTEKNDKSMSLERISPMKEQRVSTKVPVESPRSDDPNTIAKSTAKPRSCWKWEFLCLPSPQPGKGKWLIRNECDDAKDSYHDCGAQYCMFPERTEFVSNNPQFYGCNLGDNTEVYSFPWCLPTGNWSRTPVGTNRDGT